MEQFLKDYGQLISVTLIPIFIWFLGIKFQDRKSKRDAKLNLFLQMMANRKKFPPSPLMADALNQIDVIFQNNQKVRNSWKAYFDSLHPNSQHNENSNSFLLDLLSEIAHDLKYDRIKQTEIDRFYSPRFFDDQLIRQNEIGGEVLRVLKNSENYGTPRNPIVPQ